MRCVQLERRDSGPGPSPTRGTETDGRDWSIVFFLFLLFFFFVSASHRRRLWNDGVAGTGFFRTGFHGRVRRPMACAVAV